MYLVIYVLETGLVKRVACGDAKNDYVLIYYTG